MYKFVKICSGPIWLLLGIVTLIDKSYPLWASIALIVLGGTQLILTVRENHRQRRKSPQ